jgi:Fic family protein
MKITTSAIQYLSKINNTIYDDLKVEFLYHSNKLEGSTFDEKQLNALLEENMVIGEHKKDDVQTTINSLEVFDFVVKTIEENLSPRLIREWHSLLMKGTELDKVQLAGKYKEIPNGLKGIDIETAQPYEVEERIDRLLNLKINNINDIAMFHQEFEHIHPFQDGNGRIGRFIILKQCIENNIDLIAIDNEYNDEYKKALYNAQTTGDISDLVNIFKLCQERLDKKLSKYQTYIDNINNDRYITNNIEDDLDDIDY